MKYSPRRILLVDHSEDSYKFILGLLGNCNEGNFELHRLATYEAGLEALLDCRYALYLVDYSLGKYTGLELLQEAAKKHDRAPVILLTQQDDPEIELAAIKNPPVKMVAITGYALDTNRIGW